MMITAIGGTNKVNVGEQCFTLLSQFGGQLLQRIGFDGHVIFPSSSLSLIGSVHSY